MLVITLCVCAGRNSWSIPIVSEYSGIHHPQGLILKNVYAEGQQTPEVALTGKLFIRTWQDGLIYVFMSQGLNHWQTVLVFYFQNLSHSNLIINLKIIKKKHAIFLGAIKCTNLHVIQLMTYVTGNDFIKGHMYQSKSLKWICGIYTKDITSREIR